MTLTSEPFIFHFYWQFIKQCGSSDRRPLQNAFSGDFIQEALQPIQFIMSCYFNPICLQTVIWFSLINDSRCTDISMQTELLGNGKTSNIRDALLLRTSCQIMEHFCKRTFKTSACTVLEWKLFLWQLYLCSFLKPRSTSSQYQLS